MTWAWSLHASIDRTRIGFGSWFDVTLDQSLDNQHVPPHAIKLTMLFVNANLTEANDGQIPCLRLPGRGKARSIRYAVADLEAWIERTKAEQFAAKGQSEYDSSS